MWHHHQKDPALPGEFPLCVSAWQNLEAFLSLVAEQVLGLEKVIFKWIIPTVDAVNYNSQEAMHHHQSITYSKSKGGLRMFTEKVCHYESDSELIPKTLADCFLLLYILLLCVGVNLKYFGLI